MCICVYVSVRVGFHAHLGAFVCEHERVRDIEGYSCACVWMYLYKCMCMCMDVCVCMGVCMYVCKQLAVCIYLCMHV